MTKIILAAVACDGVLFAVEPRWGAIGGFFLILGFFVLVNGRSSG